MITTTKTGDIFESNAQTLVNTVNTVGVMGKGIALGFKRRFPEMFEDYQRRCERGEVRLGEPYLFKRPEHPWIINFPTKGHWRSPSRLTDIERGLEHLHAHIEEWGVASLAVPPLGCGNGELEWRVVGPILYEHLRALPIPVELYAPFGTPAVELRPDYLQQQLSLLDEEHQPPVSRIPAAVIALVAVLRRLERNPHRPPFGRIAFQKLAYFGTEAGLPTGLEFRKSQFGPFAPDLKKVTARLINNGLIDEHRRGQMWEVRVGPSYDRAVANFRGDLEQWRPVISRLVDLFSRMGTREAELAATVHFTAKQLWRERDGEPARELDVFNAVDESKKDRTPAFTEKDLALAIRNLAMLNWVAVKPSPSLPVDEVLDI